MTFRDWIGEQPTDYRNRNYVDDLELAYLAGQASVEQRVKELEQERDEAVRQWERFERMAGDNWAALKAQAGEPYGVVYEYHDYFGKHLSFRYYQRNGNYPAKSVKVYTHPTTERPYNPLNDYAIIPMNPTEPVKEQAGESRKTMFEQALDEVMETGGIFPPTERRVMEMALDVLLNVRDFSPIHGCHDTIIALRNALNAAPAKGEE